VPIYPLELDGGCDQIQLRETPGDLSGSGSETHQHSRQPMLIAATRCHLIQMLRSALTCANGCSCWSLDEENSPGFLTMDVLCRLRPRGRCQNASLHPSRSVSTCGTAGLHSDEPVLTRTEEVIWGPAEAPCRAIRQLSETDRFCNRLRSPAGIEPANPSLPLTSQPLAPQHASTRYLISVLLSTQIPMKRHGAVVM
jgi:hypothetical protein